MKLFLLTQKVFEYDTTQSVVVWAESASHARQIAGTPQPTHPKPNFRCVSEVSWRPKDAFCHEVPLGDAPKVVHTHFHHG